MIPEIQIVDHKDCIRCYQPIDARAAACPFCQSSQKKPRRFLLPLFILIAVAITTGGFVVYSNHRVVMDSNSTLSRALQESEAELSRITDMARTNSNLQKNEERMEFSNAEGELLVVESELNELVGLLIAGCAGRPRIKTCDYPGSRIEDVAFKLSVLLPRFERLGQQDAVCDALRPALIQLGKYSSTMQIAAAHSSLYRSTRVCWRSD